MAGRVDAKTEKPVQNAVAEFAADRPQVQVQTGENPQPDTKKPGDGFQKTPRHLKGGADTARKGLGSPLFGATITSYAETAAVSPTDHRQKNAELLKNYAALLAKTRGQVETAFNAWFRAEVSAKEYNITSSFKSLYNFVFNGRELSDPYNSVDREALAEWRERIGKIDNSLKLARAAIKNAEEGHPVSRGIDEDFLYEDGTILRLAEMERLGTPLTFEDEAALELNRMTRFNSDGRWMSALGSYAALQSSYLDYMPEVTRLPSGARSFASQVNTMIGQGLIKTRLSIVATSRDLELVRKDIEQYNLELARELGGRMGPALGDRGYIDIRNVDAEIARLMEIESFEPAAHSLIEKAEQFAHRIADDHRGNPEFERRMMFFKGIGKLINDPALLTMVLAGYASGIIGAWAESRLVAMGLQGWRLDAARLAIHGISFHNANNLLNFAIARPDHVDLTLGGNLRTTAVLWWLGRIQKWYGANAMPRYAGLIKADPLLFRTLNLLGMKSAEVAGLASMNLAFCAGVNGPDCLSLDNIQAELVGSAQFVIAYGALGAARSRAKQTPVEKGLELAKGRLKKEGEKLKGLRGRLATDSSDTLRTEYEAQEKRTAEAGARAFKAAETYLKEQAAALEQRQRMDPLAGHPDRAEAHKMARALVDDEIQRVRTAHEKVQKWVDDHMPVIPAGVGGDPVKGFSGFPPNTRGNDRPDIAGFHAAVEDKLNNPKPQEERTGQAVKAASRKRRRKTAAPRASEASQEAAPRAEASYGLILNNAFSEGTRRRRIAQAVLGDKPFERATRADAIAIAREIICDTADRVMALSFFDDEDRDDDNIVTDAMWNINFVSALMRAGVRRDEIVDPDTRRAFEINLRLVSARGGSGSPPKEIFIRESLARLRAFYTAHFTTRAFPNVPEEPTEAQHAAALAEMLNEFMQVVIADATIDHAVLDWNHIYQAHHVFGRAGRYEFAAALVREIDEAGRLGINVCVGEALNTQLVRLRAALANKPDGWVSPAMRTGHPESHEVRWAGFKEKSLAGLRRILLIASREISTFQREVLDQLIPEGLVNVRDAEFRSRLLSLVRAIGSALHERAFAPGTTDIEPVWQRLYEVAALDIPTARLIHAAEFMRSVFRVANMEHFDPIKDAEPEIREAWGWIQSALDAKPEGWTPPGQPVYGRPPTPPPIPARTVTVEQPAIVHDGEQPRRTGPRVRVHSGEHLVPEHLRDDPSQRVASFPSRSVSKHYRAGTVDVRDPRFIHILSEGRGSELVAEKLAKMREIIARWKAEHPTDWQDYGNEIMRELTRGDSESETDQIRVARLGNDGELLFTNGHRRIAALCLLPLVGEIPLEWLTRVPVWQQQVWSAAAVESITAGERQDTAEVLSEISVDGHSPDEAIDRLASIPKRPAQFEPWKMPTRFYAGLETELRQFIVAGVFTADEADRALLSLALEDPAQAESILVDSPLLVERIVNDAGFRRAIRERTGERLEELAPFLVAFFRAEPEWTIAYLLRVLPASQISPEILRTLGISCYEIFMKRSELRPFIRQWSKNPNIAVREYTAEILSTYLPVAERASLLLEMEKAEKDAGLKARLHTGIRNLARSHRAFPDNEIEALKYGSLGFKLLAKADVKTDAEETLFTRLTKTAGGERRTHTATDHDIVRLIPEEGTPAIEAMRREEITVGRDATDLVVSDPNVSRRHFQIIRRGEQYFVEDLGSKNGTRLTRPGKESIKISEPEPLQPGDRIVAASSVWTFDAEEGPISVSPDDTEKPWAKLTGQARLIGGSMFPAEVQRAAVSAIEMSGVHGHQYGTLAIEIGGRVITLPEDAPAFTSGIGSDIAAEKWADAIAHLAGEAARLDGEARRAPIRIFAIHTRPNGQMPPAPGAKPSVFVDPAGSAYTHVDEDDCITADVLLNAMADFFGRLGFAGQVEILAGTVPANIPEADRNPYVAVYARVREEKLVSAEKPGLTIADIPADVFPLDSGGKLKIEDITTGTRAHRMEDSAPGIQASANKGTYENNEDRVGVVVRHGNTAYMFAIDGIHGTGEMTPEVVRRVLKWAFDRDASVGDAIQLANAAAQRMRPLLSMLTHHDHALLTVTKISPDGKGGYNVEFWTVGDSGGDPEGVVFRPADEAGKEPQLLGWSRRGATDEDSSAKIHTDKEYRRAREAMGMSSDPKPIYVKIGDVRPGDIVRLSTDGATFLTPQEAGRLAASVGARDAKGLHDAYELEAKMQLELLREYTGKSGDERSSLVLLSRDKCERAYIAAYRQVHGNPPDAGHIPPAWYFRHEGKRLDGFGRIFDEHGSVVDHINWYDDHTIAVAEVGVEPVRPARDPEAGSVELPEGMLTGIGRLIAGAKRLLRRGADDPEGEAAPEPAPPPPKTPPVNAALYTYTVDGREESLVDDIDGLTPELERDFRQGYRILTTRDGDGAVTYYPIRHVDGSIGQTIEMLPRKPGSDGYEAMVREHAIYEAWKARAGFGKIAEADARGNFDRLKALLKREGIAFSSSGHRDEEPQFNPDHGMQYGQIADLLELCPGALLRGGEIKKIVIGKERPDGARASAFKDGNVLLYVYLFDTGRRYFQHIVLHEVGHGIDHGLDAETKRRIYEQIGIIVRARAVIAVETPFETVSTRALYMSAFDEFLAEMNALYIMAGDYLRGEIAKIRSSDVKRAYQEMYDFYKDLHGGREFGAAPPKPPQAPTLSFKPPAPYLPPIVKGTIGRMGGRRGAQTADIQPSQSISIGVGSDKKPKIGDSGGFTAVTISPSNDGSEGWRVYHIPHGRTVVRFKGAGENDFTDLKEPRPLGQGDIIEINGERFLFGIEREVRRGTIGPAAGTALANARIKFEMQAYGDRETRLLDGSALRNAETVVIGRNDGDLTFPGSIEVSRRHATLHRDPSGGTWFVEDHSNYGTFVQRDRNGRWERLPPEGTEVLEGDRVRLGEKGPSFTFSVEDKPAHGGGQPKGPEIAAGTGGRQTLQHASPPPSNRGEVERIVMAGATLLSSGCTAAETFGITGAALVATAGIGYAIAVAARRNAAAVDKPAPRTRGVLGMRLPDRNTFEKALARQEGAEEPTAHRLGDSATVLFVPGERMLIITDPEIDPVVARWVKRARKIASQHKSVDDKARAIAEEVARMMPTEDESFTPPIRTARLRSAEGQTVLLGDIIANRTGVCRHHALVLKIGLEAAGIPSELMYSEVALEFDEKLIRDGGKTVQRHRNYKRVQNKRMHAMVFVGRSPQEVKIYDPSLQQYGIVVPIEAGTNHFQDSVRVLGRHGDYRIVYFIDFIDFGLITHLRRIRSSHLNNLYGTDPFSKMEKIRVSNIKLLGGDLEEARAEGVFVFTEATESMGGGAGRNKMAINVFLDPKTGRIVAMGNPQRVPDEFRNGNILVSFEIASPITMAEQARLGINLRGGTVPAGAAAEIRRLFEENVRRHNLESDDPEYVRVMRTILAVTTDTPESIAGALAWRVANFTIEGWFADGRANKGAVTISELTTLTAALPPMIGSPYKPMGGMRARISSDPRGKKTGR